MQGSAPEDEKRVPRPALRRSATAVAAAVLLLPLAGAPSAQAGQPRTDTLQRAFTEAADRFHVPRSVLLGVSYLESRWDGHGGAPSVSGGYGPMHLTDARTALTRTPEFSEGAEDARGDGARARKRVPTGAAQRAALPAELPARLRTLPTAARLTGIPAEKLRTDPAANVLGGAALLAAEQRKLGTAAGRDPARWYAAVARYGGQDSAYSGRAFADEVYAVLRQGQARTTDAGQRVALAAAPGLAPDAGQQKRLSASATKASTASAARRPECPRSVACESVPAPYEEFGDGDYGNHDKADRPADQRVSAIVIHDTEGSWETTLKLIKDPAYVSWNYTIRSADGLIAQHVPTKDVAWHAGNWYINSHSVGIEHEGFLAAPDAWYTEAMYRASARLVKYLSRKYDVPLDRQHILGHDNVPGTTTATIPGMHTDPGPYWDWAHYFTLLGKPFKATAGARGGLITIRPDYDENEPEYTGCVKAGDTCAPHGSTAVRLYSAPDEDAPLVKDIGLHPDGKDSTTGVNDTGARATTGQRFAVAGRSGDWTAIWYLGQKAWFHNPQDEPVAVHAKGLIATPKDGRQEIPVYGRAYPEKEAYPAGVPYQAVSPLPYKLAAGQKYAVGGRMRGDYFYSPTFDVTKHTVVRGEDVYYEIQLGHRVGYVRAADVEVRGSGS
ncbi:N-acetylmuramoyl-L-alanine amidase [Streptomyces sp. P9-2B-2]|uniref:N-acetylmuramoyl-L-alanine amidase n=1 Tax=Streptomyces TaxID=1883 RepID=UPI0022509540|nr:MULTISPECIES: N-acetylmuramoyl-L-alanine amidase [Streptomyces]MCX4640832.1 N-acetylmuramoyl-L-alanine amidase [Streptomyces platensis]WJY36846.1 N-acetylmuramoyl-L-alanine amidase [Streptomyces sp. P9-2B-2]